MGEVYQNIEVGNDTSGSTGGEKKETPNVGGIKGYLKQAGPDDGQAILRTQRDPGKSQMSGYLRSWSIS